MWGINSSIAELREDTTETPQELKEKARVAVVAARTLRYTTKNKNSGADSETRGSLFRYASHV